MKIPATIATVFTVFVSPLLLTGCGSAGSGAVTGQETPTAPATKAASPAMRPTGLTARDITYQCRTGLTDTITVDIPDLDRLAEQLNAIQPCEYNRGFSIAMLTVMCRTNPLVVHLTSTAGRIEQPTRAALCLP